jgi:hypothetical protein
MVYDLSSDFQRKSFLARMDNLMEKGAVVELTEKAFRSPNQNRYLHLLIGVVAIETGNTLEDAKKWYFKETCNPDLFHVQHRDKMGNCIDHIRSTAELTKEEMSTAIDRFKRWGAENGIYMPNPDDASLLKAIEIEMGRMKSYL